MNKIFRTATTALVLALMPAAALADARVLTFGDSNTWGWKPVAEGYPAGRYTDEVRWPGVLDAALPEASVVVDGLVGRRTTLDGSAAIGLVEADDFNGARALPEAIARHMPLDLVVIMLGTNDLQAGIGRSPQEVARAAFSLADIVIKSNNPVYQSYRAPKVLVVAPPAMTDTTATPLSGLFQAGVEPSKQLGSAFAAEAERTGIPFFDAGSVVSTDGVDGVHLTPDNHAALGAALAPIVRQLLRN